MKAMLAWESESTTLPTDFLKAQVFVVKHFLM